MAQAKSDDASASMQKDIDQLTDQISALKQDVSGISETLAGLGRSTGDVAAARTRQKAEEIGQQATDAVRHQPAAAMGLAVGMGFLLGFLSGRK